MISTPINSKACLVVRYSNKMPSFLPLPGNSTTTGYKHFARSLKISGGRGPATWFS